jgi:hypothetical protein
MKNITLLLLISAAICIHSCKKHEIIFDHPFVYITDRFENISSSINCMSIVIEPYIVYMSSKLPNKDVEIYFEIVAGDGLREGIDYTLLTSPSSPLLFPNGTFQREIRIQWLSHSIDKSKNNTLKIVLKGNSENFTLGMPGPAERYKQHTITKISND